QLKCHRCSLKEPSSTRHPPKQASSSPTASEVWAERAARFPGCCVQSADDRIAYHTNQCRYYGVRANRSLRAARVLGIRRSQAEGAFHFPVFLSSAASSSLFGSPSASKPRAASSRTSSLILMTLAIC